jgi:hypothetical protein
MRKMGTRMLSWLMGKKKPRVLASHDLAQLSPAMIEVEGCGHYHGDIIIGQY